MKPTYCMYCSHKLEEVMVGYQCPQCTWTIMGFVTPKEDIQNWAEIMPPDEDKLHFENTNAPKLGRASYLVEKLREAMDADSEDLATACMEEVKDYIAIPDLPESEKLIIQEAVSLAWEYYVTRLRGRTTT